MNQASAKNIHPPRKRRKKFRRFLNRLGFLILLGGLVYIFFISDVFLVDIIIWQQIEGGGVQAESTHTPPQEIVESVDVLLSGKRWFLFSAKNYFLIPEKALKAKIEEFPSYQNISIEKKFPNAITIYYKRHDPVSVVVQSYVERNLLEPVVKEGQDLEELTIPLEDEYEEVIIEQVFLLSDAGVILEKIHKDSIEPQEVVLMFYSSQVFETGDVVVEEELFQTMQTLQELFEPSIQIPIESYEVGDDFLPNEIRVVTREGWKVYFDWSTPIKEQVHLLQALLGGVLEGKKQEIQYIDLRIKDKVFYK
ncbi:MAG: hypothetical protein HOJ15_03085 [Candidatus Jacksonbacteria bacterium]|jgi:hypothetical protein|nr:hypothetical protein [Candidatus Jacksonbacteria bacterium]MBT6034311.1 hypothetical protein [Candidatus Jacksonbacteria bacterium]MBT6301382.1 hypothetical protein [Candidatus Jacksonbacteria bacterium]MBT6757071.1 hypothetical protein [Candidatus Jacksonbacteria bacterium]MBT6954736.1 hypothetical protein [Candidatus Jacksonbacteria bacterium]